MASKRARAAAWVPFVFGACATPAPPPGDLPLAPGPIDQPIGAALQLDRLPATWALPDSTLPAGVAVPEAFALGGPLGAGEVATFVLPFDPGPSAERFAPPGLEVTVGDQVIPWLSGEGTPKRGGWSIEGSRIRIVAPAGSGGPARATWRSLAARVARLELGASGLPAEVFARHTHTIDGVTRSGLLVPAPGSATWTVPLPVGARFEAWTAMIPHPLPSVRSDGAEVTLEVSEAGGAPEGIDRHRIAGTSASFDAWTVDLARWGGRPVTLTLRVTPGASADGDTVFVAAPTVTSPAARPARRVVVIGLDTTRPDHFGTHGYLRDTTPALDAFAARATVFDQAWTPAPRTRPSFRTATTGRLPLDAVGATTLGDRLDRAGFATAGIVANIHLHPRFGFDRGYDLWWQDTGARADDQVDRALAWLEEQKDRDSFLFLHIMDPHLLYDPPRPYDRLFVDQVDPDLPGTFSRGDVYGWMRGEGVSDLRKAHIVGLYDGELAFTSAQLGRLLNGLDAMGGPSLVVVHNDHGEEFWEHGAFEHNHSVYDELVGGLFWIRPPGGAPGRIDTPVMLADLVPTVLDYAGIEADPSLDGRSLRPLIEGRERGDEASWARPIPMAYLRYGHERWGVVWGGHKYILHTRDGREELYDLVTDPAEAHDRSATSDLEVYRTKLAEAHRIAVGPGWRITFRLPGPDPLVLHLPQAARGAQILDPETLIESPVNQEWGEKPPLTVSDLGAVTLSVDGRTVTITPGPKPSGTLVVLFDAPVDPAGAIVGAVAAPDPGDGGAGAPSTGSTLGPKWTDKGRSLSVKPGVVLLQPPSEAARMMEVDAAGSSEIDLLRELGYIQ